MQEKPWKIFASVLMQTKRDREARGNVIKVLEKLGKMLEIVGQGLRED